MDYPEFAEEIIRMRDDDLFLRDRLIKEGGLGGGYNKEMEALHINNATVLSKIIDAIGYPTSKKVGDDASDAAWLIIQHSISLPAFMRKCRDLLKLAVDNQQADPQKLAYLFDRIAVFEGALQHYGTQFDWDEKGEMSPNPYDDLSKVNQRRLAIGLNTLEEQTELMRKRAKVENHLPPSDFSMHKEKYDQWRMTVGWIEG